MALSSWENARLDSSPSVPLHALLLRATNCSPTGPATPGSIPLTSPEARLCNLFPHVKLHCTLRNPPEPSQAYLRQTKACNRQESVQSCATLSLSPWNCLCGCHPSVESPCTWGPTHCGLTFTGCRCFVRGLRPQWRARDPCPSEATPTQPWCIGPSCMSPSHQTSSLYSAC